MSQEAELLAFDLLRSLENHPDIWTIGPHVLSCGPVEIWIANRPYSDIKVGDPGGLRIGTRRQRRKIRQLIDDIRVRRIRKTLQEAEKYQLSK